jgi:L-asparaginase II
MGDLRVEIVRGGTIESVHRVSLAVVGGDGRLLAQSGDPDLVTFWRSAAKPFQAMPLVEDGVLDQFGLGDEELALACASHSSEAVHLAMVDRILARIGCAEADLACGPHPPLGPDVAREATDRRLTLTPKWSNCSGKHAGMLALARKHGWPTGGYERSGHPVQDRLLQSIEAWTGLGRAALRFGIDGCTTVCYGLPLRNMALAYARLATSAEPGPTRVRRAMTAHPGLVAGEGRFCTSLMRALAGHRVVMKVGAEGVYCGALPAHGVGIALKVEDGSMTAAPLAMLESLRQLQPVLAPEARWNLELDSLATWHDQPIRNTGGGVTGTVRAAGHLRVFTAP